MGHHFLHAPGSCRSKCKCVGMGRHSYSFFDWFFGLRLATSIYGHFSIFIFFKFWTFFLLFATCRHICKRFRRYTELLAVMHDFFNKFAHEVPKIQNLMTWWRVWKQYRAGTRPGLPARGFLVPSLRHRKALAIVSRALKRGPPQYFLTFVNFSLVSVSFFGSRISQNGKCLSPCGICITLLIHLFAH